jgi:hypothetical protein
MGDANVWYVLTSAYHVDTQTTKQNDQTLGDVRTAFIEKRLHAKFTRWGTTVIPCLGNPKKNHGEKTSYHTKTWQSTNIIITE